MILPVGATSFRNAMRLSS